LRVNVRIESRRGVLVGERQGIDSTGRKADDRFMPGCGISGGVAP